MCDIFEGLGLSWTMAWRVLRDETKHPSWTLGHPCMMLYAGPFPQMYPVFIRRLYKGRMGRVKGKKDALSL
jgi:hypothetical protein